MSATISRGSHRTPAVRVERIGEQYEVVLEDGEQLVLASYGATHWESDVARIDPEAGARADAERYAAQVRELLGAAS